MNFHKLKTMFLMDKFDKSTRNQFNQEIATFNRSPLFAMCLVTIFMQCVTIGRIFFVSSVKLGSVNNRIYFTFYLMLMILAVIVALVHILLKNKKNINYNKLLTTQFVFICFYCVWSTAFNMYELEKNISIWQYINCMIIVSVFLYIHPVLITSALLTNHIVFFTYMWHVNQNGIDMTGNMVNSTIILIILLFVSISRYLGKLEDFKCKNLF